MNDIPTPKSGPSESTQFPPVQRLTRILYGMGGITGGMVSFGLGMFVLVYYSRVLGLSAGLVGTVLAIALIFDAISDPLVGYASDKFRSRWGRRHPFMYFASLPVSFLVYLLWNPPHESLDPQGLFVYLLCVTVSLRLLLTCFEVPSIALNPELTDDYDERTHLANYRVSASWIAMTILGFLLYGYWLSDTPEYPDGLLNISGYEKMGLASAITVFIAMLVCSIGLHPQISRFKQPVEKHKWSVLGTLRGLKSAYSEPSLAPLLLGGILIAVGFAIQGALQVYYYSYFWELSTAEISGLMAAWGVGVLVGFFATSFLSRGRDKRSVAMWMLGALALEEICFPGLRVLGLFPSPESALYYPLIFIITIFQMTVYLVLIAMLASMMADVAEKRELSSGDREEGTLYSAQMLISKISGSLGVWISGLLLEFVDFPTAADAIEVTPETAVNLVLASIAVFLIFYPAALYCLSRFRIDRAEHQSDLDQLRNQEPAENNR